MDLIGEINNEGHFVPDKMENVDLKNFLIQEYQGKKVELNLTKPKRNRSQKQNRWYWGVAVLAVQLGIKEQTGVLHDKELIHATILNAVGGIKMETVNIMGMNVIKVEQKRTSNMSTTEFNQFKESVQLHFAEKGIEIPDPIQDNYFNQLWTERK